MILSLKEAHTTQSESTELIPGAIQTSSVKFDVHLIATVTTIALIVQIGRTKQVHDIFYLGGLRSLGLLSP